MRFTYGKKYEAALKKYGVMNETWTKSLESIVMLYCSYYKMFGLKVLKGGVSPELWQMWRQVEFPDKDKQDTIEQNLMHYYHSFLGIPKTGIVIRHYKDSLVSDWYIEHPMRPQGLRAVEMEEEEDARRAAR